MKGRVGRRQVASVIIRRVWNGPGLKQPAYPAPRAARPQPSRSTAWQWRPSGRWDIGHGMLAAVAG